MEVSSAAGLGSWGSGSGFGPYGWGPGAASDAFAFLCMDIQ